MRNITSNSIEFRNFRNAVNNNKIKSNDYNIDSVVSLLRKNNIRLSKNK